MAKSRHIGFSKLWALFLFTATALATTAQNPNTPPGMERDMMPMLRVSVQNGNILVNKTPYLEAPDGLGHYLKATKAFSLEYGWQTYGGEVWQQACKFPNLGVGLQYMRIMGRNDLGHPISLYGFYNGNYFWSKNFQFTNRIGTGLTVGLATFDPRDSVPNYVISSKVNAFVELGMGVAIRISDHFYMEPGLRFTHFSNGNMKRPQRGINVASYSIGFHGVMGQVPHEPIKMPLPKPAHEQEIIAYIGLGSRQIEFGKDSSDLYADTHGFNYLMANLHIGYYYGLTRRFKLGGGLDLIYDGTNGQQELAGESIVQKTNVPLEDKLGLAIFVGGETSIYKLSVLGSFGYMLAEKRFEKSTPLFEQRLGLKYHFYKNMFIGTTLRAYRFRAAKAIEFNIGTRMNIGK